MADAETQHAGNGGVCVGESCLRGFRGRVVCQWPVLTRPRLPRPQRAWVSPRSAQTIATPAQSRAAAVCVGGGTCATHQANAVGGVGGTVRNARASSCPVIGYSTSIGRVPSRKGTTPFPESALQTLHTHPQSPQPPAPPPAPRVPTPHLDVLGPVQQSRVQHPHPLALARRDLKVNVRLWASGWTRTRAANQ